MFHFYPAQLYQSFAGVGVNSINRVDSVKNQKTFTGKIPPTYFQSSYNKRQTVFKIKFDIWVGNFFLIDFKYLTVGSAQLIKKFTSQLHKNLKDVSSITLWE